MVCYKEQCELFRWVHDQIRTQGLPKAYLPSEKRLNKLDRSRSQKVSQLGQDIFAARKMRGEQPKAIRLCISEVWGFSPRNVSKDDISVAALRKDVLACNQDYYKQLPQPCGDADLHNVIIFPVTYAREWNKQAKNVAAVLIRTIDRKGVGLGGLAERTAMKLGFCKDGRLELEIQQPGQGSYDQQLKKRLRDVVATHNLPPDEIPQYRTLQVIDPCLATAIRNYSKSAKRAGHKPDDKVRLTGQELLAEEMNWDIALPATYPHGHWQVNSNWVMQQWSTPNFSLAAKSDAVSAITLECCSLSHPFSHSPACSCTAYLHMQSAWLQSLKTLTACHVTCPKYTVIHA